MRNKLVKIFAALSMLMMVPAVAFAEYKLNLQTPNTALGHTIFDLHTIITWICVVIFILVFGFMFYAIYAHRKSVGHKAANFHEHFWVEVSWTIVPCIILVAIIILSSFIRRYLLFFLMNVVSKKFFNQFQNHNQTDFKNTNEHKPEGSVTIDTNVAGKSNRKDDRDGEYVDYEEIK